MKIRCFQFNFYPLGDSPALYLRAILLCLSSAYSTRAPSNLKLSQFLAQHHAYGCMLSLSNSLILLHLNNNIRLWENSSGTYLQHFNQYSLKANCKDYFHDVVLRTLITFWQVQSSHPQCIYHIPAVNLSLQIQQQSLL